MRKATLRKFVAAVLGLLAAALIPAVLFAAANPLRENGDLTSFLGWVAIFYFYSLTATLLFGLPAFLVLLRFGLVCWWSAISAGAAFGALVSIGLQKAPLDSLWLMFSLAAGAAAAFVFWLMWRLGSERKDACKSPSFV